jgi:hypothetical protein
MRRRLCLRVLKNERGMALLMAIGIMTVLAITGTTMTYYATSNSGQSSRARAGVSAYALAEAGVNSALSVLNSSFQPGTPTALPSCNSPASTSLEGGTSSYCGTLVGSTWTISGVGTIRNPASPGTNVRRTITRQVDIQGLSSGALTGAWSRIYNDDTSACFTIPAGIHVQSNIGTRGNLCLAGSEIRGSTTQLAVGGTVVMTASAAPAITLHAYGTVTGWTNGYNVEYEDNYYATTTVNAGANATSFKVTDLGFQIPSDATISGITVKVERSATTASAMKDTNVQLVVSGGQIGSGKTNSSFWGTSDGSVTYGSASDVWGQAPTVAEVNSSSFGVQIDAKNFAGSSTTARLDYVEMTLNYTLPGPTVGLSGSPIARADIGGTCKYLANAAHTPCTSADKIYGSTITTTPTGLQKPSVDFNYWYNNAAPGPKHGCDVSSGTPPVFDSNTTYDGSTPDAWIALDPGSKDKPGETILGTNGSSSYTCQARDAQGNTIGELSWNNATRVLTIKGTIFFDGAAIFHNHNGYTVHYQGRATIYAAGGTHFDEAVCAGGSGIATCRSASAMPNWDPTQNMMVLILGDKNNPGDDDCKFHTDYSAFQGVIWAKNECEVKDSAFSSGPILADKVLLQDEARLFPWPDLGSILPGMAYGSTSLSTDFLVKVGNQSG